MAIISAMYPVAEQVRASRIVKGVSIPHPCGDPSLSKELDARLRRKLRTAQSARIRSGWSDAVFAARGYGRIKVSSKVVRQKLRKIVL